MNTSTFSPDASQIVELVHLDDAALLAERTSAWLFHNRRMRKDYERLCSIGEAFVYAAMMRLVVRRLAHAR